MYKAIVEFYDLTDGGRKYSVGDTFPRADFAVSCHAVHRGRGAPGVPPEQRRRESGTVNDNDICGIILAFFKNR